MGVTKTNARVVKKETDIAVTFADVAGCDEAKVSANFFLKNVRF